MECTFVLVFLLSLSFPFVICVDEASFYGNSYISLPFEEAKSSTDVHFKFRTLLPNALVLLVVGTTDYCIVRLENGKIKININLGAGESELLLPHKLNDLKWHQVTIARREANLSLVVDNMLTVQKKLPGRFFELNINYGLFVGAHGNFSEIFFGHLYNFRGCLAELSYNGIMVLEQARQRHLSSVVQRITWNCAAEFEASHDEPVSFVEDDAFVLVSQIASHKEIKLQFEIKTIAVQGILYYNPGDAVAWDFFLVEIWKGTIRCIIKSASKSIDLVNVVNVSDGAWHAVLIHVTPNQIEVDVDGNVRGSKNGHGHVFPLGDGSYFGGLEASKRSRAMSKGCKYCDSSFKGCMRNIVMGERRKGLPDAYISEGLLAKCMWHYPCLQQPCKDESVCIQQGLDSFQCQCQDDFCINTNYTEGYKVFSRNSLATELELLSVEPLQVLEGQNTVITTANLHMILDYQKYGIKDSGINFYIVEGPSHGSIAIDIWPHEKNSFSLADIARDKVHYIHDGSEFHQDIVVLDVEFSPTMTFILPAYLQGRFRFSLSAGIVPANDPPVLSISETTVLRVVQDTKQVIDANLLRVKDPDSSPEQLVFTILRADAGFFENKEGVRISTFTEKDVEDSKVVFIHHGNNTNDSYVSLQVSDGIETSPVVHLRVTVSPQYWRLENNTGLIVLQQTSAVITPFNLSFTSNVASVDHKIQLNVVKRPQYGSIEVERNVNVWEAVDVFTNVDIKQRRVRYRHVNGKPNFDEFQFRLNVDKSALYTFRLTFAKCSLFNINTNAVIMNGTWEIVLSSKNLFYQTEPIKTLTTSIHYVIANPPTNGFLFSSVSKYKLRSCDLFSQEDINSHNIKYKFHQMPYSFVNDTISFVVLSPGCNNITETLNFIYHPSQKVASKVNFVSLPLRVEEGGDAVISSEHLSLKTDVVTDLLFNVTQKTLYGVLQIKKAGISRNNTNFFTWNELKTKQLYYKHDGSETESDQFKFCALSTDEENFQYVGDFTVEITLKNDNSPVRAVDEVFHVVVGGDRLITGNDLKYSDPDVDTTSSRIVYTIRESPNGNFYYVKNQSIKITEFTQHELDNNKILFKHKGPEYAKVRLWVTDGQFHVNGVLEIQASAPFIHIHTLKKLVVEQGRIAVITKDHLAHSTNVFSNDSDIVFEVIAQPSFGKVVSSSNLKVTNNFTQNDIRAGSISYLNEISNSDADEIGFRVRCKDAVNVAQLGVWLLPSNYWEPFEIHFNKLSVEESTSAIVTKSVLEVNQLNVPPSAITYYINQHPENGYVTDSQNYEPANLQYFTQDLINENRILYVQSIANQTEDRLVFNITNGIIWQNKLTMKIEIIPEKIYLRTNTLTVNEDGTVTLSAAHVIIVTNYYRKKVKEYVMLQSPKHGCIQIHRSCIKQNNFTHKALLAGVVNYKHDGSENLSDEIKLVAMAGSRRSLPATLEVSVVAVNNQKPKLVNNTGLVMWEGGTETITNWMMAVIDDDLPGDTLTYQVSNSWWGNVEMKFEPDIPISHFTQELIDKGMVLFHHQNGSEAKFNFNISDGQHTTKEYTFQIKTKPVQLKLYSKPLHIFPLQRKYLTSAHLLAVVSDPSRIVTYQVVTPPSLGRLMMEFELSGNFKIVSSFTQSDLNNSKVFYEHTHQFSDLYANDSFVFNVNAHLTNTLINQVLKIDISVSSGGLDAYVSIPKISVDEGGSTTIPLNLTGVVMFLENHAGLRSPIIHASASAPQHGQIFLQNIRNITTFTQQQLESGQVYYEHDHSDSLGDNIHFSLYLIPGYVTLCNVTVPIVVNPINDQPFTLVTPAPSLTVVQGENHTISRAELATEDVDTPPSEIRYDVISGPTQGKLTLLPNNKMSVIYFTQADIDNKILVYVHNSSVLKDSFHLRVWDKKFKPQYTSFIINVLPLHVNITPGLPVYLQQGSDVVFLSETQFFVRTNADKYKIQYTVRHEPKHGVLYVRDAPLSSFTQQDLKNDNVMYLQTDMTTANDSFKVTGEIILGNTSIGNDINVAVRVQPLMQIRNFTVLAGEYNRITSDVLDATPLAKLTNSNPKYTITNLPQYTQVRKVIRKSGDKQNVLNTVVSTFTHEEVQSGLIYLAVKDVELSWGGIQDRLVFLLAATIFQPAFGELKINIKSPLNNDIYSTLAGPNDPVGHEGGLHVASPNITRDYFLIVSMVAGVVVLGVAVIVIIKCRSLETEDMNKEQCLQPLSLPRPPDRLLSSSPPLKHSSDGFNMSLPIALPQCKVTPLGRNELEPHACYPYGVDEHAGDDWSSCDASDPACPTKNIMLRRNQYWV